MRPLDEKRLFLLDMDGTIYLDDALFDGTLDFLNYVNQIGGRYLFLTNNSSRGIDAYLEKMARLGIPAKKDDFLTSTDALIDALLSSDCKKRWYCFGTDSFCRQLKDAGLDVVTELSEDIDGLICGFDTELTFQKLEDACILLNRGVEFLATNPDWVCPTWYGYVPDCGSVCEMLFRATGRRPRFIGKPERTMAELACKKTGYRKEDALLVGDRIYTDIACAVNAGMDSCFVLSGEGVVSDIEKYQITPTYTLPDIRALLKLCMVRDF
ncbi:MAG: HAD-IIA family hydrolase [Clostridia bacterium]|nr:HAD-IIA family hydrolase [Clostridia bacterium]